MHDYGSGSVSRRKDGTWTARLVIGTKPDGKPMVQCFYGKSEQQVRKKLKEYKESHQGLKGAKKKRDVRSYMTSWLMNTKKNKLKPTSFDTLELTLNRQVFPYIGHIQVQQLTADDVQDMINNLRDSGLSYSSIKKAFDAVNDCFRTGVVKKSVASNPALGVELPAKSKFGEKQIKFYKIDEIPKIYRSALDCFSTGAPRYRLGDAVILAINTGLRIAELVGLRWVDIDFKQRLLHVRNTRVVVKNRNKTADNNTNYIIINQSSGKSKSSIRDMYLNDEAMQALSRLKVINGQFEYVLSTKKGTPVSPRTLDFMLYSILENAGFPKEKIYGFHSLRHTFASTLFQQGVDVKTVSELLGHSDVTTTQNIYIHLLDDTKRAAVSRIPSFTNVLLDAAP